MSKYVKVCLHLADVKKCAQIKRYDIALLHLDLAQQELKEALNNG